MSYFRNGNIYDDVLNKRYKAEKFLEKIDTTLAGGSSNVICDANNVFVVAENTIKKYDKNLNFISSQSVSSAVLIYKNSVAQDTDYLYIAIRGASLGYVVKYAKSNLGYIGATTGYANIFDGGIAIDNDYIYAQYNDGKIRKFTKNLAFVAESSVLSANYVSGVIFSNSDYLYVPISAGTSIYIITKSTMANTTANIGVTLFDPICSDGTYLYYGGIDSTAPAVNARFSYLHRAILPNITSYQTGLYYGNSISQMFFYNSKIYMWGEYQQNLIAVNSPTMEFVEDFGRIGVAQMYSIYVDSDGIYFTGYADTINKDIFLYKIKHKDNVDFKEII